MSRYVEEIKIIKAETVGEAIASVAIYGGAEEKIKLYYSLFLTHEDLIDMRNKITEYLENKTNESTQ